MKKYFHLGLRAKLVILVVLGILTAFIITGGVQLYQEKRRIINEITHSSQERASLVAEAITNLIIGYDYSNMESLADRIVQQQDVQRILIRNRAGKAMVERTNSNISDDGGIRFEAPVMFSNEQIGTVELQISLHRLEQELNTIYLETALKQLFFSLFLGFLIYFGASRVIVAPINRFRRLIGNIMSGAEGNAPQKLEITSRDEIGELTGIFNAMNQKVYEVQQQLQNKITLANSALVETNQQLRARSHELESRTEELEKALILVEQLATTDSLTNMPNRRYFDSQLSSSFARSKRFQERLCVMLLDIDNFKRINDSLGHSAGDFVLHELAALIKWRARETDVAARLGGDEFAFLLYHCNKSDAENLANELLSKTANHIFMFNSTAISVTLSLGIAHIEENFSTGEALVNAADKALYEAKQRGRNQMVAYPFDQNNSSD